MDNYGKCCVCELPVTDAPANLFQMDYKVPVPAGTNAVTAWGCIQCDLPIEGACAVVCEACIEKHGMAEIDEHIRFLMDGADRRVPVPPVEDRVFHGHDYSKHPELEEWHE